MKTLSNCLILLILTLGDLGAMNVSVTTACFYNTEEAYVELYSKFKQDGIQWAVDSVHAGKLFSEVEMTCVVSQEESILIAEKYVIRSPEFSQPSDFWDLKRYSLDQGNYTLKLSYVDVHNPDDTLHHEIVIELEKKDKQVKFSDIILFDEVGSENSDLAFHRSNFSYEPLEYNLVDAVNSNLVLYTEMYNLSALNDENLFVKYFIENNDQSGLNSYSKPGYKKVKAHDVEALLLDFPVDDMLSGNYTLHIELNDSSRKLISEKTLRFAIYNPIEDFKSQYSPDATFESSFFQFLTREELDYSLKAIYPRVQNHMTELLNYIVARDELEPKRYFLYSFWSSFSIDDMKSNYDAYMQVARAVDNTYGNNVGHGFETHRGYYFLKYGKPDDIVFEEDEPTAPPYEIWIYNYVSETQQTNVKFLFYNPSLAGNDFILLHSTCRGERNNPRWELDLYSDAYGEQPANYIDSREMPSNFHRNARRYFTDF